MRSLTLLAVMAVLSACGPVPGRQVTATFTPIGESAAPTAMASPTAAPSPTPIPTLTERIAARLDQIDPAKMREHLTALTAFVSRDPRHPGHAKAVAYLKAELAKHDLKVESHRATYQGIPLESILAFVDPPGGAARDGWILVSAHYDSTANRTPGWRPAQDPAPGADDNATGTAALLELARILAAHRSELRSRVVVAFFDGEELFYKGSGAYVASLARPYPYRAAINLDMVGFNPLADRLDLLWYTPRSSGLRDRVVQANEAYRIGVAPLNAQFAADGTTIMDAAPFGLAGIPSVALCQRYGENDATFPGNSTFHTVNDTPDKITNPRLWLKAAKLTLAVTLELAMGEP